MSYLLSLLPSEFPEDESSQTLHYYMNITDDIQIIQIMNQSNCDLECILLPEERILFLALPESQLEINSLSIDGAVLAKISCKLLNIHG
jgi:hypothetical protein